jgi:hypothetical protein
VYGLVPSLHNLADLWKYPGEPDQVTTSQIASSNAQQDLCPRLRYNFLSPAMMCIGRPAKRESDIGYPLVCRQVASEASPYVYAITTLQMSFSPTLVGF